MSRSVAVFVRNRGRLAVALACGTFALVSGCRREQPRVVPVSGQVRYAGKPLAEAKVLFVPQAGGRPATGDTDQQGRFRLTTFERGDGALVGEHAVTVFPPGSAGPGMPGTAPRTSAAVVAEPLRRQEVVRAEENFYQFSWP